MQYVRCFIIFLCDFILVHGPEVLAAQMDRVQPGILAMLLQQVRPVQLWLAQHAVSRGLSSEHFESSATSASPHTIRCPCLL